MPKLKIVRRAASTISYTSRSYTVLAIWCRILQLGGKTYFLWAVCLLVLAISTLYSYYIVYRYYNTLSQLMFLCQSSKLQGELLLLYHIEPPSKLEMTWSGPAPSPVISPRFKQAFACFFEKYQRACPSSITQPHPFHPLRKVEV
jgi:hypothetical protein